jgi:hypothetical protein
MVRVSVEGDRARLDVEGWNKLWALRSQLEIPLSHIRAVRADSDAAPRTVPWPPDARNPESWHPHGRHGAVFYDVPNPERTIVIDLEREHYTRLIIEVESPDAAVALLQSAIAGRPT